MRIIVVKRYPMPIVNVICGGDAYFLAETDGGIVPILGGLVGVGVL